MSLRYIHSRKQQENGERKEQAKYERETRNIEERSKQRLTEDKGGERGCTRSERQGQGGGNRQRRKKTKGMKVIKNTRGKEEEPRGKDAACKE